MEELFKTSVKKRTAARSWATRAANKLSALCSSDSIDNVELNDALREFEKRLINLDDIQFEVEQSIPEDQLAADIEKSADFREELKKAQILANKKLVPVSDAADDAKSESSAGNAKLPKLSLPTFSGDVKQWSSFWEQFLVTVDDTELSEVTKFTYLRSVLKGEAKATIQGFSLNASHYKSACEILKTRFGRPEKIIFSHLQDLLTLQVPKHLTAKQLWETYDILQTHIRSLEALSINGNQYGVVLTPLVLSRLPSDLRMEWAREGEGHESDLVYLMNFLQKEIERRDRSQSFVKEKDTVIEEKTNLPTACALVSSSNSNSVKSCQLCKKGNHAVDKCFNLTKIPLEDRKDVLKEANLCFKCLSNTPKHNYRKCSSKCKKCQGAHHVLLHSDEPGDNQENVTKSTVSVNSKPSGTDTIGLLTVRNNASKKVNNIEKRNSNVLLQTAKATVHGKKFKDAIIVFDTGSDRTYISQNLVHSICPEWVCTEDVTHAAFGDAKYGDSISRNIYNIGLFSNVKNEIVKVRATEVPVICATMRQPSVPQNIIDMLEGDIQMVDVDISKPITIDILIGLDIYWKIMMPNLVTLSNGLVAQKSLFGWIMSGVVPHDGHESDVTYSHNLLCLNNVSEEAIKSFWELESVGVTHNELSVVNPVINEFENSVRYSEMEKRYSVSLPWKSELHKSKLIANEASAKIRLYKLSKKLDSDSVLKERYNNVIAELETLGIIHQVMDDNELSGGPIYYMPHRPVIREDSTSTKVRPVFDCSAKGPNGISLNDCLESGPCLLPSLVGILMKFRRWKFALSADIQKAFLQIKIQKDDQNVHRFFWLVDGKVKVMRFDRVPFGNTSSPFLLNATVQHHLSKYPESKVVNELKENMYVDNWLSGCDTEAEAHEMFSKGTQIMSDAGMILTKWSTNSRLVSDLASNIEQYESIKILGLKWNCNKDCFTFDGIPIPSDLVVTKRVILSFMTRLFDPLGFLNPYIMIIRCLFQDVWRIGLTWDEVVPSSYNEIFMSWINDLSYIKCWEIQRTYFDLKWTDISSYQIHAFGDASEKGYGSVVYLRMQKPNGEWASSFIISKVKVAPLKRITLPRLELMASLLTARLVVFVKDVFKFTNDVSYNCWTDSRVALSWIKSDPHKWKPFISNRISEIHAITSPSNWRHCPGKLNPADLVTRGISGRNLILSKFWLCGPAFLWEDTNVDISEFESSSKIIDSSCSENLSKESCSKYSANTFLSKSSNNFENSNMNFDVKRWSSLCKSIRVVGWVLRFIKNVKCPSVRSVEDLSFNELCEAKTVLLKDVQKQVYFHEIESLRNNCSIAKSSSIFKLNPFLGKDGLIRVKSRLQFSDLNEDEKFPIIIPKGHMGTLLACHVHITKHHTGVNSMVVILRDTYWIIGCRNICRSVKRLCISCQRQDSRPIDQCMAPLPSLRIKQAFPFAVTGMDHAGPLYCNNEPNIKYYILLFTCAVVRAIHIEMVDSLSAPITMLAIRRFMARRGICSTLLSDNEKGFIGASRLLLDFFSTDGPRWQFIPPRAPWWGGWWERLVGSVKSSIKKSVGRKSLTRVELETVLHEIEACVNSRPLLYTGDGLEGGSPLTPSHFLIGRFGGSKPVEVTENISNSNSTFLKLQFEQKSLALETFWHDWSKKYIRGLPPFQGSHTDENFGVGSKVLVCDHQYPKLFWPLGVIQKVYPGKDGNTRSVEVRTSKGVYKRAIQGVHKLEISDTLPPINISNLNSNDSESNLPTKTDTGTGGTKCHISTENDDNVSVKKSRFGRTIKARNILDL